MTDSNSGSRPVADPIRWGIMGTARIATRVTTAINATPAASVRAVASRTAARAGEWAAQHDVEVSYEDYDKLLDDENIDAVYIPLPPALHAEWTERAAAAGKHVLCEKPLAMTAAEGERMIAACAAAQVQLMDATMWVHHHRSQDMRTYLQGAEFGPLRRVTSAFGFQLDEYLVNNPAHPARTGDEPVKLEKAREHEIRLAREMGGGSLMDLGWYCVRATLWTFGELPERVFGTARFENDVDLNFSAILWFSGNRMASFDCGYDIARRKWFEICGERQSLVCDDFLNPWDPEKPRFWVHDRAGAASEHISPVCSQEQLMVRRFCEIIRSGQTDDHWPQVSLDNLRVVEALDQSARSGEVVTIAK